MMKTSSLTSDFFLPRSDCYCQFALITTMVTEDTFFPQDLCIIYFFRGKISLCMIVFFSVSFTPSKLFSYMKKVEKLNEKLN